MKIRRKKSLILSQNKRQLILYSTIIEMPYYSKLKNLLSKYEKIYETDFEDLEEFDDELKNIFKFAIKEITETAEKEWQVKGNCNTVEGWPIKFIRCQLCNTKNRYVFYIENKLTGKTLNVGSECMQDFPTLSNVDGINIRDIKKAKIKEAKKVARILRFNERFPDVQNLIKDLEKEYEEIPILLPYKYYLRVPEVFKEMRKLYVDYINNKIQDNAFSEFEILLQEYFSLKREIEKFIEENINNNLICTREIKEWLELNGKNDVIEQISKNNALYSEKTIEYITNSNFLNRNIKNLNNLIKSEEFEIIEASEEKIYFTYGSKMYNKKLKFYITNIEFMHLFGITCFIDKNVLEIDKYFKYLHVAWNSEMIENILSRFDNITKQLGYSITYKKEFHKVAYKNKKLDRYKEISLESFVDSNIDLLFLTDKDLKDRFNKIFNKIKWQKIEDESRYEFSAKDISKNPYT